MPSARGRWVGLGVGVVALAALLLGLVVFDVGPFGETDTGTQSAAVDPVTGFVPAEGDLAGLVDPFVGTAAQRPDVIPGDGVGGAFPGAAAPFGMLQWGPDTSGRAAAGSGGYRDADSTIDGFSLTHVHGTSCPAAQDLAIMPSVEPLPADAPTGAPGEASPWAAGFSHDRESAAPGRYQVELDAANGQRIGVDLAAGIRTGVGRFTYPSGRDAMVVLDAGRRADGALRADVHVDPATGEVSGSITSRTFCRVASVSTLYFVVSPEQVPTATGTWAAGEWSTAPEASDDGGTTAESESASAGAWLRLTPAADGSVTLRTAVSYVSVEGARANLAAENPTDVDGLAEATRAEWNRRLATLHVDGPDEAEVRTLYTALYHSMLGPGAISDADGRYVGWDGQPAVADGWTARSGIAGWDAYRSTFPLLAMLAPDVATDAARSLIAGAAQTGSVPGWTLATSRPDVMPGDGGTVVLAQAVAFGLPIDPGAALAAGLASASQRPYAADYERLGWVPAAPIGPFASASITQEYALADFAVAQLARAAGQPAIATAYAGKATRWRSVWDATQLLPAARDAEGALLPVEPTTIEGFTEGSAAQYTWFVPQDPDGLAEALGGRPATAARLTDFLSRVDDGAGLNHAEMGNQPSLMAPWLGSWFGDPALTTDALARTRAGLFKNTPDGLPGNDDTGGLSAWYVLSALGFGPVQPGTDLLSLSPPAASAVEVTLAGGTVRIDSERHGGSAATVPVGLQLDGVPLDGPWVRFGELSPGAVLTWSLADEATTWGVGGPPAG